MSLRQTRFLFLDCQTTGMRPPSGHLLELAWSHADATTFSLSEIHSHLIRLPEGHALPARVSEITGIQDVSAAEDLQEVFQHLQKTLSGLEQPLSAIIHYAQFEKPFLTDLFSRFAGCADLPFSILCSQQLTKRLFPNLPSQNIRAAGGFFGAEMDGIKRAGSHVRATQQIWQGLVTELEKRGIHDMSTLAAWLKEARPVKRTRYEYRLDRFKRLELPDSPGIYRMLSKSGEVLYVGKATSLKSRVNSYFRGQKGRDLRKLEMLAQVWDLRVTGCATPLEAALLECDEIKRFNPPYNVVLKRGRRTLVFYPRDFSSVASEQSAEHSVGPFREHNWIEHLRLLARSLQQPEFEQVFFNPIPSEDLRAGFLMLCANQNKDPMKLGGVRGLLAWGLRLHRNYIEPLAEEEDFAEPEETEEEVSLSCEEIAAKFERLLRRAGAEYQRAQQLTRLLDAQITLRLESGPRSLHFVRGVLFAEPPTQSAAALPWQGLAIDDYDRMSILLSELAKYDHQVEYKRDETRC